MLILLLNVTLMFVLQFHGYKITDAASEDENKCLMPEITSNQSDLDVRRFTSEFTKVSEVKFPGIVGPLKEHLICKIKCIDGNWVGPLCSTNKDGRFQPLFRQCIYAEEHPLLVLSFRNESIKNGTALSHGSAVAVRCSRFGVYKLKGSSLTRCHNGEWLPRLPDCVPTTLLTNFTGDAPPSITYKLSSGSAWLDPSGELWLYPESVAHLECVSRRSEQDPVWSWTQVLAHYPSEWSSAEEENTTHYRLSLGKVSARHSDQYTCSTPNGLTNTVALKVVSVVCPQLVVEDEHLVQTDEGIRLGQSIRFDCKTGFRLNGSSVLTCTGSGRWSGHPPRCTEAFCPLLRWQSPHIALAEYNSSAGGRAVFRCAWGYRLIGNASVRCDNGAWSGEPPACLAVYCPRPGLPDGGFIVSKTEERHAVGDLVVYECSQPRRLVGESSVVCTESGFWSHPPPFCVDSSDDSADNGTFWDLASLDTIYTDNATGADFHEI